MVGYHKAVGVKEQLLLDKSAQGSHDIIFHECSAKSESGCKTNGENPCKRPIYMSKLISNALVIQWFRKSSLQGESRWFESNPEHKNI